MKKTTLTTLLLLTSIFAFCQDVSFSLKLRADNGNVSMVIIEDYGNYSYISVNNITAQIDEVKETLNGVIYICRDSGGKFTAEFDLKNNVFRFYFNNKLEVKGTIIYAGENN